MDGIEDSIIKGLLHDEEYTRKVLPHLNENYFEDEYKVAFNIIKEYIEKYNKIPVFEAIGISLQNLELGESIFDNACELFDRVYNHKEETNTDWLVDETEKYCQRTALNQAIFKSIDIIDGNDKKSGTHAIPDLLKDALAVEFDITIGHDYMEDSEKRYEMYHSSEERVPFGLEWFDNCTRGGMAKKSLTICMGDTNTGKSLILCSMASYNLLMGKNVLYITMEMSEQMVSERIDANMMDIEIDALHKLNKDAFNSRFNKVLSKTKGRLQIKEFPTGGAHVGHFKMLLDDYKTKKNFIPDIIIVDYMNICASSKFSGVAGANSYTITKSVAEELRGFAVENDLPVLTATQTNRSGASTSDPDMTNVSDSYGTVMTADMVFAVVSSDELKEQGLYKIIILKNRWGKNSVRFMIGVDYPKMKIYDTENQFLDADDGGYEAIPDKAPPAYESQPVNDIKW